MCFFQAVTCLFYYTYHYLMLSLLLPLGAVGEMSVNQSGISDRLGLNMAIRQKVWICSETAPRSRFRSSCRISTGRIKFYNGTCHYRAVHTAMRQILLVGACSRCRYL
ncbi:hypothetical protein F5Y18DRAFT_394534 [Xylariaceae sp. FL1019]|nr:hypothetical protein F5Y18DRAFT_394534 [Xylariaceae sp. FL1019]